MARTSNIQSYSGDGPGRRSTAGQEMGTDGPPRPLFLPMVPTVLGGKDHHLPPTGEELGALWANVPDHRALRAQRHPDRTDPELSSLHPTAPALMWCGGNFQNVLPLAESSIQGKNGREELQGNHIGHGR